MILTEWLDEIPDDWACVPAWSLFSERADKAEPDAVHLTPSQAYGVLPQTEYMEITGSRVVLNLTGADKMKAVYEGDFISHLRSFQGGLEQSSLRGKVSQAYTVLRPSPLVQSGYFRYLMKSRIFIEQLNNLTDQLRDGQTINYARFARMGLPLPPLESQRIIAQYLDHETYEIDAMLAKLASLSESVSERRREIVRSLLKAVGQTVRLGLVVDVVSGSGFPDRFQGISDEELPFYKVSSLANVDRQVLTDSENTVSREIADQLGARIIPSQSVVMAKIGAALLLARYALTSRPSCIDNNMQALVPHQGVIVSRFLAYAMEDVSISSLVKPGPVPSLDVMGMKMSRIAFSPSIKEQCRIADHLDEVTGRIDAMLATIDELKALLVERRAALITDVVTGRKKVPA